MIKLRTLLPKSVQEAIDLPPVTRVEKPAWHSYAKPAGDGAGKQYYQSNMDFNSAQTDKNLASKAATVIKKFENSTANPRGGFDKVKKRWYPHKSLEGGSDTIAYGHKLKHGEDFSQGLTDGEAEDLLRKDVNEKIKTLQSKIHGFDGLPLTIKIAAINAMFRGDLGPKTMSLLAQNQFDKASKEYLNHAEYRTTKNNGVKKRMEWNAAVFSGAT